MSDVSGFDSVAIGPDWCVLRDTILESLFGSPHAFLATAEQVAMQGQELWEHKLSTASWAVVQYGHQTLGIAAAKPPGDADDYALPGTACFIESVWIAPQLRAQGIGQRLLTYLMDVQRQAGIQEFFLWVLDHNDPALRLYDRMNFKRTGRPSGLPETQFLRKFDSDVLDYEDLRRNLEQHVTDRRDLGITYRMLAAEPARIHLPQRR